ncbi:hypothetical protein O1L55_25125 [Streptomyces albulus]|nr:hypothetical protein [Streptomyces noursei]
MGTPFLHHLPRHSVFAPGWPSPRCSLAADRRTSLRYHAVFTLLNLAIFVIAPLVGLAIAGFFKHDAPAITNPWLRWITLVGGLAPGEGSVLALSQVSFTNMLLDRARLARTVFAAHADRWLGLWAPEDEAISLLKGLAIPNAPDYAWLCRPAHAREPLPGAAAELPGELSVPIPVRLNRPRSQVQLVPSVDLTSIPRYLGPVYWAFNRWAGPRIGTTISRLLLRTAQGNDLPGAVLVYATPAPLPLPELAPALPEMIVERLERRAQTHAGEIIPGARRVLA